MESNYLKRITEELYLNKKIVYFDFQRLMGSEFVKMLNVAEEYIVEKTDLLIIFDVTNATVFGEALNESKLFAKRITGFRKKTALLGITGPKKILLDSILFFTGVKENVQAFNSKNEALNWLSK